MRIALASPTVAHSFEDGFEKVQRTIGIAAEQGAEIICFPEAYLPGLHGVGIDVLPHDETTQAQILQAIGGWSQRYRIATILGTERISTVGRQIAACVFGKDGTFLGWQTKNQLDPSEDPYYVPGNTRQLFEVGNLKFGIAICHEGWRYPETVRWAAMRGAHIVFHPQHTGSDEEGIVLQEWGSPAAPYYEKAMRMRSIENTIYFASVNYGLRYQEAATTLINPEGECQAYLPYGKSGVLIAEIDLATATGLLAKRYAPERYQDTSKSNMAARER